jgi:hypothetical protein
MVFFWAVESCILVDIDQCFRGTYRLHNQSDDEGSKILSNIGQYLPHFVMLQLGRHTSFLLVAVRTSDLTV